MSITSSCIAAVAVAAAVLGCGTAQAQNQTSTVGKAGSFAILRIIENGRFHRCAASIDRPENMLRIAGFPNGRYNFSVPNPGMLGKARIELAFAGGGKYKVNPAAVGPDRIVVDLAGEVLEEISLGRGDFKLTLVGSNGSFSYVWPLRAMDKVFEAINACVENGSGGAPAAAAPPPERARPAPLPRFAQPQIQPAPAPGVQAGPPRPQGGGGRPAGTTPFDQQVRWDYDKAGDWTIEYFTSDQQGSQVLSCAMSKIFAQETALRVRLAADASFYEFLGDASAALGKAVPVTVEFATAAPGGSPQPTRTTARLVTDPDTMEWLSIRESNSEPGSEDAFANADQMIITSARQAWRYPLKGSNAAFKRMLDCKGEFIDRN